MTTLLYVLSCTVFIIFIVLCWQFRVNSSVGSSTDPIKVNWMSLRLGVQRRLRKSTWRTRRKRTRMRGNYLVLYSFTDEALPLVMSRLWIWIDNNVSISPSRWFGDVWTYFRLSDIRPLQQMLHFIKKYVQLVYRRWCFRLYHPFFIHVSPALSRLKCASDRFGLTVCFY